MATCTTCATDNPAGQKFCGECGAKLEQLVVREERKMVTVLFCDLVGFTARSDRADPEDVRALVRPFHEILRTQTERFGGTLARIVGDAGMVVFGYPLAHEDDPERAVRAGFAILSDLEQLNGRDPQLDLHARAGINTCEAVVTYGSATEDADDLMGDGVNLAARLQGLAPADAIVVGQDTYLATRELFEYLEMEPTQVKGKAEPVPIYRPIAPAIRRPFDVAKDTTPFVGRDAELASLIEALDESCQGPRTRFVTIVAEPGIGKSRLVRELARHVDSLARPITWRQGRCLPYGDGISFWALGEIIKAHADIFDTDDQATVSAKLDQVLVEPDEGRRSWMKSRIAPLVGLETTVQPPKQQEAFTAWRRFIEQIATRPLVMVIEDLHWADDALVAFLGHMAELTTDLPILVIATTRPEVTERHPTWLGDPGRVELGLAPLVDQDISTLVGSTIEDASPELLAAILERAGGSPLYAEQLAVMVGERAMPISGGSLDSSAIPPSVQALLAARIDMLSPQLKDVLFDASVVGKTFWSGALAALGDRGEQDLAPMLDELVKRSFIHTQEPSTKQGQAEFAFVHALMKDVAYSELPRQDRLIRHRATAAWISDQAGEVLGEDAELVVAHLDAALDLAETLHLGDERDRILPDLTEALIAGADHAMRTGTGQAKDMLKRALELLEADDPRRPAALATLGTVLSLSEALSDSVAAFDAAADAYRAVGDLDAIGRFITPYANAVDSIGEEDRSERLVKDLLHELEGRPGPGLVGVLAEQARTTALFVRDLALAKDQAERALALADELHMPPPTRALVALGECKLYEGDETGEVEMRKAVERALEDGDPERAIDSLNDLAVTLSQLRGGAVALPTYEEAIALGERVGFGHRGGPFANRLVVLSALGRWDEVLEQLPEALEISRDRQDLVVESWLICLYVDMLLERGDPSVLGVTAHDPMLQHLAPPAMSSDAAYRASLRLGLQLARGEQPTSLREFEEIVVAGEPVLGSGVYSVRWLLRAGATQLAQNLLLIVESPQPQQLAFRMVAEALIAEASGDLDSARDLCRDALVSIRSTREAQGVDEPSFAYAVGDMGRYLLALGETQEGIERLREARELWVGMKARPRIAEIDALLSQ